MSAVLLLRNNCYHYFTPGRGVKYCPSLCLSVCLHFSKPHVLNSPYFIYMLPMAVAQSSSDGSPVCYVFPIFLDDVMLSQNGADGSDHKPIIN